MDASAVPYAVAAAGTALALVCALTERRGGAALGRTPEGGRPDTTLALLPAVPAWLLSEAIGVALGGVGAAGVVAVTCGHVAVVVPLVPWLLRRSPAAPAALARRLACGVGGGLAAYGLAGLVGLVVTWGYAQAGAPVPEQNVVEVLREAPALSLGALIGSAAVLAPCAEEVLFRGLLLNALAQRMPRHVALLAQALLFGFIHFAAVPSMWPLALPLAVVGWCAGWLYLRTGSLLAAVVLHATFNGLQIALLFLTGGAGG